MFNRTNVDFIVEINNCDKFIFNIIKSKVLFNKIESETLKNYLLKLEDIEVDFFLPISNSCILINFTMIDSISYDKLNLDSKIKSRLNLSLIQFYIMNNILIIRNNNNKLIDSNFISKIIKEKSNYYFSNILQYGMNKHYINEEDDDDKDSEDNENLNNKSVFNYIEKHSLLTYTNKLFKKESSLKKVYSQNVSKNYNSMNDNISNKTFDVNSSSISNSKTSSNYNTKSNYSVSCVSHKIRKPKKKIKIVNVFELFKRIIMLCILNIKQLTKQINNERKELESIYLNYASINNKKRKNCYIRIFNLEESIISVSDEVKNKFNMLNTLFNKKIFKQVFIKVFNKSELKFDLIKSYKNKLNINNKNQLSSFINKMKADVEQLVSFILELEVNINSLLTSIYSIKRNFKIILDDLHREEDTQSNKIMMVTLVITTLTLPVKLVSTILGMNIINPISFYTDKSIAPFLVIVIFFSVLMYMQYITIKRYIK